MPTFSVSALLWRDTFQSTGGLTIGKFIAAGNIYSENSGSTYDVDLALRASRLSPSVFFSYPPICLERRDDWMQQSRIHLWAKVLPCHFPQFLIVHFWGSPYGPNLYFLIDCLGFVEIDDDAFRMLLLWCQGNTTRKPSGHRSSERP